MERCAASRSGPRNQSKLGDSRPTGHDGGGAPKPPSQAQPVEAALRTALEAVGRVCERREESRRSQPSRKRRRPAQCSETCRSKGKRKEQMQRKKQRRQSEEGRTFRMKSSSPGRDCLAGVVTGVTLPEDGLHIGRSKFFPCGRRGRDNPWKVAKAVENYGKMLNSLAGRWLRWRLHEFKSSVLYCHCREGPPCHGDVIVRAFAEAKSEEEQRHSSRASISAR